MSRRARVGILILAVSGAACAVPADDDAPAQAAAVGVEPSVLKAGYYDADADETLIVYDNDAGEQKVALWTGHSALFDERRWGSHGPSSAYVTIPGEGDVNLGFRAEDDSFQLRGKRFKRRAAAALDGTYRSDGDSIVVKGSPTVDRQLSFTLTLDD
jgi:hypothetical protein